MIKGGLLGCGTVGGGVIQLLRANAAYLEARVGDSLDVARVLVRDPDKERVPLWKWSERSAFRHQRKFPEG